MTFPRTSLFMLIVLWTQWSETSVPDTIYVTQMIADFYLDEGSACQKPESIKKKKKGRLIYEWQTFICDLLTRWNSLAVKKKRKKRSNGDIICRQRDIVTP